MTRAISCANTPGLPGTGHAARSDPSPGHPASRGSRRHGTFSSSPLRPYQLRAQLPRWSSMRRERSTSFTVCPNVFTEESIMRFRNVGIVMGLLALLSPASEALAGYSLFGDAQIVQPGNNSPNAVQIRSTCPGGSPTCFINNSFTFAGVDFDI